MTTGPVDKLKQAYDKLNGTIKRKAANDPEHAAEIFANDDEVVAELAGKYARDEDYIREMIKLHGPLRSNVEHNL